MPRKVLKEFELKNLLDKHERFLATGDPVFEISFKDCEIDRCNFEKFRDLSNVDFSGAEISQSQFNNIPLNNARFDNAELWQVSFQHSNLEQSTFKHAKIGNCMFNGANIKAVNFTRAQFTSGNGDVTFQNNNGKGAIFFGASLRGIFLGNGCNFQNADFTDANCFGANFNGSNLSGARFKTANVSKADFRGANLEKANFSGADLHDANFIDSLNIEKINAGKEGVVDEKVVKTASTLANAFVQKSEALKRSQRYTEILYLYTIFIIFCITAYFSYYIFTHFSTSEYSIWASLGMGEKTSKAANIGTNINNSPNLLVLVFLGIFTLSPLIWVARYFGNKNRMYLALKEFYDHKVTVSEAISGFREAVATDKNNQILIDGFKKLTAKDPSDKIVSDPQSENYPLPIIQIVEKALEIVDRGQRVKKSTRPPRTEK